MIGHLVEQRCDGVVAAVKDQQQRRNFSLPEVKQLIFFGDDLLRKRKIVFNDSAHNCKKESLYS